MEDSAHYQNKDAEANANNQSMIEIINNIKQDDRRFELAKTILSDLLHDERVKKEIILMVELFPSLTEEQIIELFGENISLDDVSNYVLSHKAINLADTFLKIFNKKQ